MNILGLSAWYHDAAACLLRDGEVVAAAQEERFSRVKHDARFPRRAAQACLELGGLRAADLDAVAFYDKPFLKLERILETHLAWAPRGLPAFLAAMPVWLGEKLWAPDLIAEGLGWTGPTLFAEHHESHAASAFFPSPFDEAAFLTLDGVGEWTTTSWGVGSGARLELQSELRFPHSLGLLYSAFTGFCGFKVNSGEYKLMGLAPYGTPRYAGLIREKLIDVKEDGSFALDMDWFEFGAGLRMTGERFARLFGGPPRAPDGPLTQREKDLAASIQEVTEEVVLKAARHVRRQTGRRDLCLAGGVALNCVANGKLHRAGIFERLWVQPAAGDAGGALGAAYLAHHHHFSRPPAPRRRPGRDRQQGSFLGPAHGEAEVAAFLSGHGLPHRRLDEPALLDEVSRLLAGGKVVGWFQGRMEYGPRALGHRSILADPRPPEMQQRLNLAIKLREGFRPFAPAVPAERAAEWFDLDVESPYMLLVAAVKRRELPAVTHVDGSARVQTVDREDDPRFHALLNRFGERTGCPVLVNTSFNVRGEPPVESPLDAWRCFMQTGMDALVLGDFLLLKDGQPPLPPAWAGRAHALD